MTLGDVIFCVAILLVIYGGLRYFMVQCQKAPFEEDLWPDTHSCPCAQCQEQRSRL